MMSSEKRKIGLAGAAGAILALGVTELVRGLTESVPSFALTVAQRVIELTPGSLATAAIGTLGSTATAILLTVMVTIVLAVCAGLAILAQRSVLLAGAGAVALGAVGVFSSLGTTGTSAVAILVTGVAAVGLGILMCALIIRYAGSGEAVSSATAEEQAGAIDRRKFMALAGGAAVLGLSSAAGGRVLANQRAVTTAASTELPSSAQEGGISSAPEPDSGTLSFQEVEGMPEFLTPNDDFYLIDTATFSPNVNNDDWALSITGNVSNPFELSYDELLNFPAREETITIACVSNEVGGDLVGNARWTGVRLADVLEEAGLRQGEIDAAAEQIVGRSVDGWTGGFRTELALDGREALIAYGMNGEALPRDHGYPARLVIPGLYGYVSATKWLEEIELTDWDFDAYWIQRNWAKEGPILTQSRIDTISQNETLSAGTIDVGGIAWAPTRGIEQVEVSTDGGDSWEEAELAEQATEDAWRHWLYRWEATPGDYTVQVRATDGTGETQTAELAEPIPSGATGHHTIEVTVEG